MMLKTLGKKIIGKISLLKYLFIWIYQKRGSKPWSLGYSVYKYTYIKNVLEKDISIFHGKSLPAGYGAGLDERAVEYPWLFSVLKNKEHILLDAGSTLNHQEILNSLHLKYKKLFITTLGFEGVHQLPHQPSYTYEDLRDLSYKSDFFDAVACLSTLEHIGLDNTFLYSKDASKNEDARDQYLNAIKEFKRVLKPGGTLYVSVPFGRYKNHEWFQIFDAEMADRAIKEFAPQSVKKTFFRYENDQWNFSNEKACENGYYFDVHQEKFIPKGKPAASECVLCLEMIK